ncbi:MAG: valine--tRNA ligase [Chthonomonas sp.]|nr:valine--tRNA ligase [Chthonomonas sp.]
MELSSKYDASQVEAKWYQAWESAGLFQALASGAPRYTITIPPPNITGSLHMGHSLCYPIQDVIGRYKRLRGFNVLIIPGQDHAGIATQSVVSKQLKQQGIQPSELGREKFVEKVWEWRKVSGDTIIEQFRSLGCAFDWSKSRFTLDEDYANAVLKVFIDWFNRGLIYRGKRVVNWDPVLQTSVSDIETERKTINGKLYHVRYPFTDGSGEVIVATTRPETMLGDVAVAVNPSDKRYDGLIGKTLRLPLIGREIPLLADPYPDPEFGTGAVKITPAHDPNDYEVGARHQLEMPVVLDDRAKVSLECKYQGMDRYEARKAIVADLEDQGFLVKVEDHQIPIIVSERSGEVVEPLLSEQWFVKQTELAGPGIEAVKAGKIKFTPERYTKVYLDWMENIRDWCISRQLWWGHRIPVYYTEDGKAYAALSLEDAQQQAGADKIVRQDEDVLDTWFSSGLWPFATQGWPDKLAQDRYPTNVLVTDRNIIYLWVARMIMMGMDFAGDIPFQDVCIHATVMTEDGRRMSKSLGTGVDPTEVIERVGADALRYTLLSQAGTNQEIRYSERRVDDARNFCNKIWNAARFILMNVDGPVSETASLEIVDKWLLSRLSITERLVREAYEAFDFQRAANSLYQFFWSEMCDWYLEVCKSRLLDPAHKQTPIWVLLKAMEAFVTMLHPIMPHITEELYQNLPLADKAEFVMIADWPEIPSHWNSPMAEQTVERWFNLVRATRALRADLELDPKKDFAKAYVVGDLAGGEEILRTQAWITELSTALPEGVRTVSTTVDGIDVHLPIEGAIDLDRIATKLTSDEAKLSDELSKLNLRLSNPQFVERAKPEIVEREQALHADLQDRLDKIKARRQLLGV